MAFEFGMWSEGAFPLLFVCEEAHRYASADRSLGFGPTRRALSRIAKEGRKYGVFLGIASQRPAELDPTIISQCSTLFAMRMANDRDQAIIRSAVSDAAANLVSLLPSLGTREVLAFGEGVPLPARIAFGELPQHFVPTSKVKYNGNLSLEISEQQEHVEVVVARWRGATSGSKQGYAGEPGYAPAPLDSAQSSSAGASDRFSILKRDAVLGSEPRPRRVAAD
jgi:DNA helicase HerA-like ATPase